MNTRPPNIKRDCKPYTKIEDETNRIKGENKLIGILNGIDKNFYNPAKDKARERRFAMIDFHSHILPEIDDGAKSVEESIAMLKMLKEQGVEVI